MMTIKQTSERLGVSLATVYREVRRGRLHCHRFGKRAYRVSEQQLQEYLALCHYEGSVEAWSPPVPVITGSRQNFQHVDVSRLLSARS